VVLQTVHSNLVSQAHIDVSDPEGHLCFDRARHPRARRFETCVQGVARHAQNKNLAHEAEKDGVSNVADWLEGGEPRENRMRSALSDEGFEPFQGRICIAMSGIRCHLPVVRHVRRTSRKFLSHD